MFIFFFNNLTFVPQHTLIVWELKQMHRTKVIIYSAYIHMAYLNIYGKTRNKYVVPRHVRRVLRITIFYFQSKKKKKQSIK